MENKTRESKNATRNEETGRESRRIKRIGQQIEVVTNSSNACNGHKNQNDDEEEKALFLFLILYRYFDKKLEELFVRLVHFILQMS